LEWSKFSSLKPWVKVQVNKLTRIQTPNSRQLGKLNAATALLNYMS